MKVPVEKIFNVLRFTLILILLLVCSNSAFTQTTTVQGIVTDSVTGKAVEFATVRFEGTTIGKLTDETGRFTISNRTQNNILTVSLMGYETQTITVPKNTNTKLEVKLKAPGVQLGEIVVRPGKEKYSKKNNPAVELIKKVIQHKYDYLVTSQNYYMNDEHDKLVIGLNDYKTDRGLFKKMTFLNKYIDTSQIDDKPILPFSIRETLSNVYYRKEPKGTRRVVTAHRNEGIDQDMNTESIDGIIEELFKDINITDNRITLMMNDFVSPLSSAMSVDFYKWYIIDTIAIEDQKYINLGFVPFNTRDVGFMGNIYVKADSSYAVKRVSFRVPSKINVNYLDEMLVTQDFRQLTPDLWIPEKTLMAMDLSLYGLGRIYVERERTFENFIFNIPVDAAFQTEAPVVYLTDYKKREDEFWNKNRPVASNKDYKMNDMVDELRKSNKLIDITFKAATIFTSGYIATNKDEEKNKVDIGTTQTFYSYNHIEGNRLRLTASTTTKLHPHLFLYGYGAYGTKDSKFKYYGEATWAFNRKEYHKDEFPKRNLMIAYKYDLNALGQRFLQSERDNILMSLGSRRYNNMTYNRMTELSYIWEMYNGFSYSLYAKNFNETPAGNLKFETMGEDGNIVPLRNMQTTEVGATLRWALKEKFFQQRRKRRSLPSDGWIFSLSHAIGLKGVLGGDYSYHKTTLDIEKEFWLAPYGRIGFNLRGEKLWGTAPFPLLLSPNANSSITIQRGSFYNLRALEFINDEQLSWDISYLAGGWLFNRIPLINMLKLKEVIGFRGFWGHLSKRNDPANNPDLLIFPENVYRMTNEPYMEYSVGIQNIFQFFRIDYVRRINYLHHKDIDKSGFRISFEMAF